MPVALAIPFLEAYVTLFLDRSQEVLDIQNFWSGLQIHPNVTVISERIYKLSCTAN